MPLIPVLRRQRHEELCKFETRPLDREISRIAKAMQRNPVLENKKTIYNKKETPALVPSLLYNPNPSPWRD